MSVRHLVYQLVAADEVVESVYGDRIVDEGAVGRWTGTPAGQQPGFPFLVLKYGEETRGVSRTTRVQLVEFWSYDTPTDLTRHDHGLDALYALLHQRGGDRAVDPDGGPDTYLVEANWEATSRGLVDDVLRASVRYATYRLVTNTP